MAESKGSNRRDSPVVVPDKIERTADGGGGGESKTKASASNAPTPAAGGADGGLSWAGTGNKVYQNVVETRGGGRPKILSRSERPHVVLGEGGALLALTNGVTEAWPCALQAEPDRPPCPASFDPYAGVMPDCGPGSNGTSIWCPIDYCYTMWQTFKTA